jgi:hypothetical protein
VTAAPPRKRSSTGAAAAFRRAYGAGPIHLVAVAASIAIAAYALSRSQVPGKGARISIESASRGKPHDQANSFSLVKLMGGCMQIGSNQPKQASRGYRQTTDG